MIQARGVDPEPTITEAAIVASIWRASEVHDALHLCLHSVKPVLILLQVSSDSERWSALRQEPRRGAIIISEFGSEAYFLGGLRRSHSTNGHF